MWPAGVLYVMGGNDRGRTFELRTGETRIGRGTDQDVVLSDIAVSRRHITIEGDAGRYRLRDLGSGNGTLVNGKRIDLWSLSDGDIIELGTTVLRFDHPPSRSGNGVSAGAFPPPAYDGGAAAPAASAPPMLAYSAPSPPVYAVPAPIYTQAPQGYWPSSSSSPSMTRDSGAAPYTGTRFTALLGTPLRQAMVFGAMGLLCLLGIVILVDKTFLAKPVVVPSEAEELYREGLRLYGAEDFSGAEVHLREALKLVPDSPEVRRYAALCQAEVRSHNALESAQRALLEHHYIAALKAFDDIDGASQLYEQAMRLRRETAPNAAIEHVKQAQPLVDEDVESAKAHVSRALELDPDNREARALGAKLHLPLPAVTTRWVSADVHDKRKRLETTGDEMLNKARDATEAEGVAAKGALKQRNLKGVAAQQAFAAGKYEQAYQLLLAAPKGSDSSLLKQLEAKAAELVAKGVEVQKGNLAQAKSYWRSVLKMVPPGSASYNRAYGLLNNSGSAHRDEDEE